MSASKFLIRKSETTRVVAGIDFSLSCPAMVVHEGKTWSRENCKYFYLYGVKKWLKTEGPVVSEMHRDFANDSERLDWITGWFVSHILALPAKAEVFIEDYSYSSGSSSTHILAEGAGLLKWRLWREGMLVRPLPVGTIKKFATGKGNAVKERMCEAHLEDAGVLEPLSLCPIGKSPIADLVDAYYIAKLGHSLKG